MQATRNDQLVQALRLLTERLNDLPVTWAITGGCNLLMRGCLEQVNDIDVITSEDGATRIAHKLGIIDENDVLSRTRYKNVSSCYASTRIAGVPVEIMGDPDNQVHGIFVPNRIWNRCVWRLRWEGLVIPAMLLEYELYIYSMLGNNEVAQAIRRCLAHGGNRTFPG